MSDYEPSGGHIVPAALREQFGLPPIDAPEAEVEAFMAAIRSLDEPSDAENIVAAIDRLTAEVKALREAQETALRLAQQVTLKDDGNEH